MIYLKVLRQLIDHLYSLVYIQIKKSINFLSDLCNYISITKYRNLNSNLAHIYLKIHSENKNDLVVTPTIYENFLNYFTCEEKESTLYFLTLFIRYWIGKYEQMFFQNSNNIKIAAQFIRDLNNSVENEQADCLSAISFILTIKVDLFFINDLKVLIDIILRIFEASDSGSYAIALEVLILLFEIEEFTQKKYRVTEIIEIIEMLEEKENYSMYKNLLLKKLESL